MEVASADSAYFGKRECLRRHHRLIQRNVVALLRQGTRFNSTVLALRMSENSFGQARLAIAVPKRILKSAVDRNRVKRIIREQFRKNRARKLPIDILVTLRDYGPGQQDEGSRRRERHMIRQALLQLLADVSRRFGASPV